MSKEDNQSYPKYRISKKQEYMHIAFSKILEYNEDVRQLMNARRGKHQLTNNSLYDKLKKR